MAVLATGLVALNSLASALFLLGVNSKSHRPLADPEVLLHCGIFLLALLALTCLFGVWPFGRRSRHPKLRADG